jgi:2-iminobutanoate/2-iminopropanoate deaminase
VTGFTASGIRRGGTAYFDAVVGTGDDIDAQARQAFARLDALLQAGGVGLQDVAVVTVYLTDMADLPRMNTIFKETFPTDPPARVTIQVQPQAKERIRIALIAAR